MLGYVFVFDTYFYLLCFFFFLTWVKFEYHVVFFKLWLWMVNGYLSICANPATNIAHYIVFVCFYSIFTQLILSIYGFIFFGLTNL